MNVRVDEEVPNARIEGLIERSLSDGDVIVYDVQSNAAHCLNRCAWLVWRACDGRNDLPTITRLVSRDLGDPVGEAAVSEALRLLGERNLLTAPPARALKSRTLNRRQLVRAAGVAAALGIPVVTSILAPTAYAAVSACINTGQTCTVVGGTECCAGLNCTDVGGGNLRCV